MMRYTYLYIVALVAVLTGCGDEAFTYSDYHCNLTIDNSTHLDATLATAMDANSPGVYCIISTKMQGGAKYFTFANNQGLSSQSIFKATDDRLESQKHVGMNGRLIVGYGNMDNPATFRAYDGECPDCFDPKALPVKSYPLTVNGTGVATCSKCKRQFNLNTDGNGLTQYRASTTGAFGRLQVY